MSHLTRTAESVNEKAVEYFRKAFTFLCVSEALLKSLSQVVISVTGVTSVGWHERGAFTNGGKKKKLLWASLVSTKSRKGLLM